MQSIFSPVEFEEYLLLKTRDFSDDINDETTRKQWREVYLASQIQTLISPSVAYTARKQCLWLSTRGFLVVATAPSPASIAGMHPAATHLMVLFLKQFDFAVLCVIQVPLILFPLDTRTDVPII